MSGANVAESLSRDLGTELFPPSRKLVPDLSDIYELELAFHEHLMLTDEELLKNSAYFASVGDVCTRHFLMCTGSPLRLPDHSSSRLKSFFEKNIFRTGYATHGLFPYRGKFHPQMVKGLINAMGVKPGETVLDPMMGSGTTQVEAALMGVHSVGIDASPFCRFMAQTKMDTLTMSLARAKGSLNNHQEVFEYFRSRVGASSYRCKPRSRSSTKDYMALMEPAAEYATSGERDSLKKGARSTSDTYNFLLLAYMDSVGYSERSKRKTPLEQFRAILERYVFAAEKIQSVLKGVESDLGHARILVGDARSLPLEDSSIDGVLFSPPYSFAVDYLENDAIHLNFLGVESEELRSMMVGLRGRKLPEKFEFYKEDMAKVVSESARVLRKGRICTIVVGTNSNQLSKVLDLPPANVPGLNKILIGIADEYGMKLVKQLTRPITGISNTMRRECIIFFQKA